MKHLSGKWNDLHSDSRLYQLDSFTDGETLLMILSGYCLDSGTYR
jgi:hypothetical protein